VTVRPASNEPDRWVPHQFLQLDHAEIHPREIAQETLGRTESLEPHLHGEIDTGEVLGQRTRGRARVERRPEGGLAGPPVEHDGAVAAHQLRVTDPQGLGDVQGRGHRAAGRD
jgi:hypothetical protein